MLLHPKEVVWVEQALLGNWLWLSDYAVLWKIHELNRELAKAIPVSYEHKLMFLLIVLEAHYAIET